MNKLLIGLILLTSLRADVIYDVTVDTTSLIGHPSGPFSVGFEFADGSGTGDGNNVILMSNFNFGSGSITGPALISGSAGGDMGTSIVMTDATPTSIFIQSFKPGMTFTFLLDVTSNVDAGGTPDQFIMSILDNTLTPIPSKAGTPLNPLLVITIDSLNPTVQTFASDPTQLPAGGGDAIDIAAPTVSQVTPEPSTCVFVMGSFLWTVCKCFWLTRRKGG